MSLFSCSGTRPAILGIKEGRLAPCPSTPNCVSSDAAEVAHSVPVFQLNVPPADAWRVFRATLESLPRTTIVTASAAAHFSGSSTIWNFTYGRRKIWLRCAQRRGLAMVTSA